MPRTGFACALAAASLSLLPTAAGHPQEGPEARISATFLLQDGKPAKGAKWYVSGWQRNADAVKLHGLPKDWETLTGTLDVNGRIDLRFEPPQAYQFTFSVRAEGFARESWRFSSIKPTEEKLLGTIEMKPECPIVGRIVGADGVVLSQQSWHIRARETRTSGFGDRDQAQTVMNVEKGAKDFTVLGLPPGEIEFNVTGRGRDQKKAFAVVLRPGETLQRDFVMAAGPPEDARVTVRCRAKPFRSFDGPNLKFVKVVAADGTAVTPSAGRGSIPRFTIESDSPGPFTVSIRDPRFEPLELKDIMMGARVRAELRGTASLKLNVLGPDGETVTDYSVDVSAPKDLNGAVRLVERGAVPATGWIRGLVPSPYEVTVRSADGVARTTLDPLKAHEKRTVDVQLETIVVARGTVRFPSGEPAVGAEVHLVRPAKVNDSTRSPILMGRARHVPDTHRERAGSAQCGASGAYEIELPGIGEYVLVVRETGKSWVVSDVIDAGQKGVQRDFTLPFGALLKGTVLLPAHLPKSGWQVYLARDDHFDSLDFQFFAPELDSRGTFRIVGARSGPVDVYIRQASDSISSDKRGAPNDGYFVGSVVLEEGGAHGVQCSFDASVPSMVTPVIASNIPLDGQLSVTLFDSDDAKANSSSIDLRGRASAEGVSFKPKMMTAGEYDVWFSGDDWAVLNHPAVSIEPGKALELPLRAEIYGRRLLVTRAGAPAAGAKISVHAPRRRWRSKSFQCDQDGYVTLRLDEGDFQYSLVRDGIRGPIPVCVPLTWPTDLDSLEIP